MDVKAKGTKWLSLALCLTAGFSLSACSDDDDEGGNGGAGSGVAAQQMPKVADAGIQFPVTQYSEYDTDINTFTYSDGRMTGGSTSWESRYSITSNPLVLTEQADDYSGTYRNIRMNSNGFMTYAELSASGSDSYDGNWYERGSITWRYDAEGHLLSESGKITDSSDGPYSWICTYTWENGNLMNAEYRDEEDGEVYRYVCTFSYGDGQWDNPGVYPAHWINVSGMEMPVLFYSGLMGRTTKNIPTSVTERDFDGDEESYRSTYNTVAVNYNQDRSIQSIEVQNVSSYGSSYTETYRFGYADYPIQQEQSGYSAAPAKKSGQ